VFVVLIFVGEREIRDIRADMMASSALMGTLVAEYAAAPLAFEDRHDAAQVLLRLGRHDDFLDAALYDFAGQRFTAYATASGETAADKLAPPSPPGRVAIEGARIVVVRPVERDGARFGTLVLHTSTAPLASRVRAYLWGISSLMVGVLAASLMLAWALEKMVS